MMEAGTEEFLFVDAQPQTEANIQVITKGNQGCMSLHKKCLNPRSNKHTKEAEKFKTLAYKFSYATITRS